MLFDITKRIDSRLFLFSEILSLPNAVSNNPSMVILTPGSYPTILSGDDWIEYKDGSYVSQTFDNGFGGDFEYITFLIPQNYVDC